VFTSLPPTIHEGALRAYIAGASHVGVSPAAMQTLVSPWLDATGQDAFYRQIAQADQAYTDEIEPLLPDLDLPVLVAWGEEDAWIPVERAHRLAGLIPGAELRLVAGAGHLIQLDQPTVLATMLANWLEGFRR
jgi:pimeloyl-ACP methyl ester carboxylesterase